MIDRERFSAMWNRLIDLENRYFGGVASRPLTYWSNALAGEVGEICNAVNHRAGGGSKAVMVPDVKVLDECADGFAYLILLAERDGWSPIAFAHRMELFAASENGYPPSKPPEFEMSNVLAAATGTLCDATAIGEGLNPSRVAEVGVRILDLMCHVASPNLIQWDESDPVILYHAMDRNAKVTAERMQARAAVPT